MLRDYTEYGRTDGEGCRIGKAKSREYLYAAMWLEKFANLNGDRMPHEEKIHLPSCNTKHSIYELYKKEKEHENDDFVAESTFLRMWNERYSHIKIPKVSKFVLLLYTLFYQ